MSAASCRASSVCKISCGWSLAHSACGCCFLRQPSGHLILLAYTVFCFFSKVSHLRTKQIKRVSVKRSSLQQLSNALELGEALAAHIALAAAWQCEQPWDGKLAGHADGPIHRRIGTLLQRLLDAGGGDVLADIGRQRQRPALATVGCAHEVADGLLAARPGRLAGLALLRVPIPAVLRRPGGMPVVGLIAARAGSQYVSLMEGESEVVRLKLHWVGHNALFARLDL
eukprot:2739343-Prymnesium_polylepis.1